MKVVTMNLLRAYTFAIVASLVSPAVFSQTWPLKPINLIWQFPPGGATESVVRAATDEMSRILGQPIIFEYKPGAAGRIGSEVIFRAAPDGYTFGLAGPFNLVIIPLLDEKFAALAKGYTPITMIFNSPLVLTVNPGKVPARSFWDFVSYAKAHPKIITYGSTGAGGTSNLWTEVISAAVGIDLVHVPYKSEGQTIPDHLSGEIQANLLTIGTSKPHVDSGRIVALATTGRERAPALPNVPTLVELGVKDLIAIPWVAFIGPANIPKDVAEKLNAAAVTALRKEAVVKAAAAQNYTIVAGDPADVTASVQRDLRFIEPVVRSGRVKLAN